MTKRAVISGSLVDVKNVNVHKCVRLTIEVPAELATTVIEAFGWPTQVNPVSVAVARLDLSKAKEPEAKPSKPAQSFATMPPAQQAGIYCADPVFWRFLAETFPHDSIESADDAAKFVRAKCLVASRSDIDNHKPSGRLWRDLVEDFRGWKLAAEVVG